MQHQAELTNKARYRQTSLIRLAIACFFAFVLVLISPTLKAYADDSDVAVGDKITFSIEQKVNKLGTDAFVRYDSMVMYDDLPAEVKYLDARVFCGNEDITTKAGNVIYDPLTHKVSYEFSDAYLASGMALNGETYRLVIDAEVIAIPADRTINNTGYITINGTELTTNETNTPIEEPNIVVNKTSDKDTYASGDPINYTITINQTQENAALRNVVVEDDVPDELTLNADSVKVEGSDGADIKVEGNKITVTLDRINHGQTVTLTYTCYLKNVTQSTTNITNAVSINGGVLIPGDQTDIVVTPPVTYNVDGSNVYTDDQWVADGKTAYTPIDQVSTDNTKPDATFSGWYLDPELTTPYDPDTNGNTEGGFTLYGKNIYQIDASADEGGSISEPGTTKYYYGDDHTYTISADEHWVIDWVEIDGVNQGAINSYTFSDIAANHTIVAHFKQITHNVTFVDELTGETVDEQTVIDGDDATDPGAPEHEGYEFIGWDTSFDNVTTDLIITGKYKVKTTSLTVNKTWDDDNDRDGLREDAIFDVKGTIDDGATTVVEKTVTLDKDKNQVVVNELPAYQDLKQVVYTVEENVAEGYTATIGVLEGTWSDGWSVSVTNTCPIQTTSVTVAKSWNDDNNRDGLRPETITATLSGSDGSSREVVLSAENDWSATISDLPVNYNHGTQIEYTLTEASVKGYTSTVTKADNALEFSLTNTHEIETIDIPVDITWIDDNDRDGIRPDVVEVILSGSDGSEIKKEIHEGDSWNGIFEDLPRYYDNGKEIDYTLTETTPSGYTSEVEGSKDGFTVINAHGIDLTSATITKAWNDDSDRDGLRPDTISAILSGSDGSEQKITLSASNNWTTTVNDLPVYTNHGQGINYTVTELSVDGYTSQVSCAGDSWAFTLTNTHEIETIDIPVDITWVDDDNRDGIRPDVVDITLSGSDGSTFKKSVSKDSSWEDLFTDLPRYYDNGKEIDYTLTETTPSGYTSEVEGSKDGFTVTNTHEIKTMNVTVNKIWDDAEDQDGARPDSVNVELVGSDGQTYPATLNETDGWTYTWSDIPVNMPEGITIEYAINELMDDDTYGATSTSETDAEGNLIFTLTNTHEPATVNVAINVTWSDDDDRDGLRPGTQEIVVVGSDGAEHSVTVSADEGWGAIVSDLPMYANGELIDYSIKASAPDGYMTEFEAIGDYAFTAHFAHTPDTRAINVTKSWLDGDNTLDTRTPAKFILSGSDGSTYTQSLVNLTSEETLVFADLPVNYDHGTQIDYTLEEVSLNGYVSRVNADEEGSYQVTNTLQQTIDIPVKKVWINDSDSDRPDHITFDLLLDGEVIQSASANAESNWTAVFEGIERFDSKGEEIPYAVVEHEVDGYITEAIGSPVEGFTVTNTLKPVAPSDDPVEAVQKAAASTFDKTGATSALLLGAIGLFAVLGIAALIYAWRKHRRSDN